MAKQPKLIATVTVGEQTYEIDVLDLKTRERIALEEFMGMPLLKIQAEGWVLSEKALSYIGFLAKSRKAPTFTYEQFLDAADDGGASIVLSDGSEGKKAAAKKSKPAAATAP